MMKRKHGIAVLALVTASGVLAQISIPGIPQLVADPTAWADIVTETQGVAQVYTAAQSTYTQLQMDAMFMRSKNYWRGFFTNAVNSLTRDQAGETGGWNEAVTKGINAPGAYGNAAIRLQANPLLVLGTTTAAQYATAEIGQGASIAAMTTLGNARNTQLQMDQAIQNCEAKALSTADADNTQATQQNIANACQSLLLRQSQTQLGVESARLELEVARAKADADNITEYSNMLTVAAQAARIPTAPGGQAQTTMTVQDR